MIATALEVGRGLAKRGLRRIAALALPPRPALAPELGGLTALDGRLSLDGVDLAGLLRRHGSPLHVLSAARLRDNARAFRSRPPGVGAAADVFYSYKTNPVPGALKLLHREGIGAEVISHHELWLALRLGVDPSRIIFNGPARSDEAFRLAVERGVKLVNLNAAGEIDRVAAIAASLGKVAEVGIRVCPFAGQAGQFGEPVHGGAALAAFRHALQQKSLRVTGLHVHSGRRYTSARDVAVLLDAVLPFVAALHRAFGLSLETLDLGGGLAVPSAAPIADADQRLCRSLEVELPAPDPGATMPIPDYVGQILRAVEADAREREVPAPRVILEPGRAMTGNAQLLLTQVVSLKTDDEGLDHAILDAGVNVAQAVQHEFHQLLPVENVAAPRGRVYRLCGPICTHGDVLYNAVHLPALAGGDALAIMDSGAYFVPFSTRFSYPLPAVVLVDQGREQILQRAETSEDLLATSALPPSRAARVTG